jgi:hypothetical protein
MSDKENRKRKAMLLTFIIAITFLAQRVLNYEKALERLAALQSMGAIALAFLGQTYRFLTAFDVYSNC